MARLLLGDPARTLRRLRWAVIPLTLWAVVAVFYLGPQREWLGPGPFEGLLYAAPKRMTLTTLDPLPPRIPCVGPRGRLLSESPDDELRYGDPDGPYPVPFIGSQREAGLGRTWMTADGRYGPYGYGEAAKSYKRKKVDWDSVDWGKLQDECLERNARRFPADAPSAQVGNSTRFTLRDDTKINPTPSWDAFKATRRTALVLRSYEGFQYKDENMWMIRSLITEAALRSGGEYGVILLVNIQNREWNIHESQEDYDKALEACGIPPELRSITVLWDDRLLETWYSRVQEHRSMWQINQPFQLFALHYPEFDHYWQLELDQRFTGDALEYFDSLSEFARSEPRKQALERATYPYSEQLYESYSDLIAGVDSANHGHSRAWGALRISDVQPIGPIPPTRHAKDGSFRWGVGEDADLIVTNFCADVRASPWVFRDWFEGQLSSEGDTPRWFCPPAIVRSSRALIHAAHAAQHDRGLSLPSESVMPTWALWLGLKLSYPPQPNYMHPYNEARERDRPEEENDETSRLESEWRNPSERPFFGDLPHESPDGLSHANPQSFADRGLTHWWASDYPRSIMDAWLGNEVDSEDLPPILQAHGGQVYAPNFAMHPVKT